MYHPEDVLARKAKRLQRKQFWTVGVNDIWSVDQHDKWRKYQLFLHVGLEPFSGYILWLKVWWTNRNPKLVCSFHLDTIQELEANSQYWRTRKRNDVYSYKTSKYYYNYV